MTVAYDHAQRLYYAESLKDLTAVIAGRDRYIEAVQVYVERDLLEVAIRVPGLGCDVVAEQVCGEQGCKHLLAVLRVFEVVVNCMLEEGTDEAKEEKLDEWFLGCGHGGIEEIPQVRE